MGSSVSANRKTKLTRKEYIMKLMKEHLEPVNPGDGWKGPSEAIVSKDMAGEVEAAMEATGRKVDSREETEDGKIRLYTKGYYHHNIKPHNV